jgi:hypothetical protein
MVGACVQRSYLPLTSCLSITLFALAGCGGPGSATVTGKVTVDGQRVTSGMVHFTSDDGKSTVLAHISGDGIYSALDVSSGTTKITIVPLTPISGKPPLNDGAEKGKDKGAKIEPSAKIPARYSDPNTSGLTFIVKSGANTHDIEMSSK